MVDLSDRVHEWVWDFAVQVMERMCGNTRHQMYNAILAFCSAICTNSLSPPLINCTSLYLGTTLHPTGKSASITGFTVNENDANEYRPWDELQLDCCRLIRDCLDAFSVLNFPLVCKTWKGVYAEKRRLQPGAPTLLTSPSLDGGCTVLDEHHRGLFFLQNILSRETFSIELDSLRYHNWIGGKDEWMVITDLQDSINVLNPITGACSDLFHDQMIMYWAQRIQLCQTPAEADGYFAIAISHSRLAYTTVESGQWIMLENPNHKMYMRYCDAILHRGWEEYDFILAPSLNGNLLIVSPYGESLPIRLACNRSTFRNRWNFTVLGAVIREVDTDAQSLEDVHGIDLGDQELPGKATEINYNGPASHPYQVPMWFRPAFP
ncbi:hypothetical protein EJB05_27046 [Eragrostis curvula]|uniref:KIB1-4 beta-propeller domain-containing protein n=1 Tax=Eragrostis curvula TaxID=38414 RepID=A0A5J9ULD5_9POAL|nr:hypothetical protein EJB05_27046 [Eragrostis curvula]